MTEEQVAQQVLEQYVQKVDAYSKGSHEDTQKKGDLLHHQLHDRISKMEVRLASSRAQQPAFGRLLSGPGST